MVGGDTLNEGAVGRFIDGGGRYPSDAGGGLDPVIVEMVPQGDATNDLEVSLLGVMNGAAVIEDDDDGGISKLLLLDVVLSMEDVRRLD